MPELRKDPVIGRWVIVATERARRPGNIIDSQENIFGEVESCPFCNNQDQEIYAIKDGNGAWKVRVVPNGTPILRIEEKFKRRGHGLYDLVNGFGAHEVVIETPQHVANMADLDVAQITLVIQTYVARFKDLEKNAKFQYPIAYKSYGWSAGSRRIGHARSQIIVSPVNPSHVKEKLRGSKRYFDYHERCLYCDLIRQELEAKSRIVLETEHFLALTPFAPRFTFEIWIFPKKHNCDFAKGVVGQEEDLAKVLKEVLLRLKIGIGDPAYNYVIQTAPFRHRKKGGRWRTIEEDYHWHIEVMPRLTMSAGFEKGSGFYICSIPPEHTAEFLREVNI